MVRAAYYAYGMKRRLRYDTQPLCPPAPDALMQAHYGGMQAIMDLMRPLR